ncbi:hypothetical protein WN48_04786 [Eufriesea mexicana]|uniref:Uncharacterized protein n=1 Tax=Eufriesea mexicana TaxID=516756 RepID=A0A310SUF1_9HYME|nr:hypothetical protein WN48_04786 [Eufriesea mexicana]
MKIVPIQPRYSNKEQRNENDIPALGFLLVLKRDREENEREPRFTKRIVIDFRNGRLQSPYTWRQLPGESFYAYEKNLKTGTNNPQVQCPLTSEIFLASSSLGARGTEYLLDTFQRSRAKQRRDYLLTYLLFARSANEKSAVIVQPEPEASGTNLFQK